MFGVDEINSYFCRGMKKKQFRYAVLFVILLIVAGCIFYQCQGADEDYGHKVVVCIPVYGQSYALGEEAVRITNFDSLRFNYGGRIVTEKLDYTFGYFDHSSQLKQWLKRILHYDKKAFELSVYGMAEVLAQELGEDTVVCVFPGGHGMEIVERLMKPVDPYNKFIEEIETAYDKAQERGWEFFVPAVCWMQGESDIVEHPDYDYKERFHQMYNDMNEDIKAVTHQKVDIRMISYQCSTITKSVDYKQNNYDGIEGRTPTAQMELIRDETLVWASGPTYPYDFVNESLHIDARGQHSIGRLAAKSALGILRGGARVIGLMPLSYEVDGNEIRILYHVPCPPLCFDTVQVRKADNYGFNVIRQDNVDIISEVSVSQDTVIIKCIESPVSCKLRYGINGEFLKGGRMKGPRGNLRDSQMPICDWSMIFEKYIRLDVFSQRTAKEK